MGHHNVDMDDDDAPADVAESVGAATGTLLAKPPRDPGRPVKWYRPKIAREELSRLNQKSDAKAFAQTLGFLATLAATGSLFVWTCYHAWYLAPLALLLHGGCMSFLINGFHELVHESVFKTRWLNSAFLYVFSFLGWYNHVQFWASHTEHHKFTLHPPDDLEVVLPQQATVRAFLKDAFFSWGSLRGAVKGSWIQARSKFTRAGWEEHLFVKLHPELQRPMRNWARFLLVGHAAIVIAAIATGWWPVAIAITYARFFGNGVHFLCNASQHIGLVDHYPDFRLCCRTIYLSPPLQFLYWHMNYHTEHHMFAGVPCYNLGRLHRAIKHEMPECPRGLFRTWRQIGQILARQKVDPTYQFVPAVPKPD